MALGALLPALGSLTSLTSGGALTNSQPATSGANSATGAVNVGGLNVPALPSQQNTLILAGAAVVVAWLAFGRKR